MLEALAGAIVCELSLWPELEGMGLVIGCCQDVTVSYIVIAKIKEDHSLLLSEAHFVTYLW